MSTDIKTPLLTCMCLSIHLQGSDTLPNLGGTYFSSAVDGVGSAGGSTRHSSSSDSENDTKEDKDASEDEVDDDNDNNDDDGDNDDDDSESSKELLEYTSGKHSIVHDDLRWKERKKEGKTGT